MTIICRTILMKEKNCKKFLSADSFLIFQDIFIEQAEELRLNITIKMRENKELLCYK